MKIHLIAIGGSVMHNLAIALLLEGHDVSGSDDQIYEPAAASLKKYSLFPSSLGWDAQRITSNLDLVIAGMHARADNPELLQAEKLGIKVLSYPEYIYQRSKNKERIVIAGSHGKTTTTAMVMHVLKEQGISFDYVVGAKVPGFERSVSFTNNSVVIVVEGDEYFSSAVDRRPKMHCYHHHIGVVTGVSWDHMNIFPTEASYLEAFETFVKNTPKAGTIIGYQGDKKLQKIFEVYAKDRSDIKYVMYEPAKFSIKEGITYVHAPQGKVPLQFFGAHNISNMEAAREVCERLAIRAEDFYTSIQSFKGAHLRMQLWMEEGNFKCFRDFAHAPSKVKATTLALYEQFSSKKIMACLELYTFSSLNKDFLQQYKGSLDKADQAIVYFNPENILSKGFPMISKEEVINAFSHKNLSVITDKQELIRNLKSIDRNKFQVLMMSSGTFDKLDPNELEWNVRLHSLI